ncbi:hypothetical protein CR152_29255 [Massilia violaceinigra]|uniref:Uncharacterized protein n=1 Tax=Massilia violaceinigra TaxID=2045208 RepID=A0A2D2DT41_9BURK|nr:hypothetical protein [Massilia violaceinigra]ATQ78145.1 hypothetical protein CR152_29255 [Massilia violaceinigra]
MLAGTLPYKTVAIGSRFQLVPDNLKWKFKTNIYAADGFSDGSDPIIEINRPTSTLAGKKITLSFAAATKADEDLIASYMPKPHLDGTPIQPHEFPTSLPGYLLRLKAQLRVDGELVAQTPGSFTMGSEVRQSNQFYNPSKAAWDGGADNDIVVGEYNAIGMDLQGNGAQQLKKQQARMEATHSKLKQFEQRPNDTTLIEGLTKEDVAGDLLQAGILAYFAKVNASNALDATISGNMKSYRLPSYGRFYTSVQPSYWFGIARNVSFPGMGIDVDYLFTQLESSNANASDKADHMRRIGAESSAAEHTIPEILARNAALPASHPAQPQGVSAVKALAVAAAQGQRIYALNSRNLSLHSTILQSLAIDQDVKSEIANALASGKEVTVHEKNIAISGWTGSGYLILDPQTGAGAYKIAGGGNGGEVIFQGGAALFALTQIMSFAFYGGTAIGLALVAGPVVVGITLLIAVVTLVAALATDPDKLWIQTELTKRLAIIVGLVQLGALAFALSPFLFFFVFIALLLYIALIIVTELGFNLRKNRPDWRYA